MTSYKYFYIMACLFIIIQHQTLTSKVEKIYKNIKPEAYNFKLDIKRELLHFTFNLSHQNEHLLQNHIMDNHTYKVCQ